MDLTNQSPQNFINGGFPAPQVLDSQIPGAQTLPQLQTPGQQAGGTPGQTPPNGFNSLLLNQLGGSGNAGINHSFGSGGMTSSYDPRTRQGPFGGAGMPAMNGPTNGSGMLGQFRMPMAPQATPNGIMQMRPQTQFALNPNAAAPATNTRY